MNFKSAITSIIDNVVLAWNEDDYSSIKNYLNKNVRLYTEPINLPKMQVPAIEALGLVAVIEYWKEMKTTFAIKITHYEIIEAGRNCKVICYYENVGLTIELRAHIDEYGKATEIVNHIKAT